MLLTWGIELLPFGKFACYSLDAAIFLFNTYRGFARLVLKGSDECIFSKEGATQGDPLSMLIYAVALLPLVKSLKQAADLVCR